jgi:hypothetical protein
MDLAALGAFLSGAGSVLASVWALRSLRRRMDADCRQRIEEIKQALREGLEMRQP